jgi:hypothetical protein
MSAAQYSKILTELELGASDAARMLGMTARMSRSYVNGEYPVPPRVAICLRLVRDHIKPKELERFRGRPPGRPPGIERAA